MRDTFLSDEIPAMNSSRAQRKLVIFDMDGVLCHLSDDRRIEFLSEFTGRPTDVLADAIWTSGFEASSDNGDYSASEYLMEFGERVDRPLSREEWMQYRKSGMSPNFDTLAIARNLATHHQVSVLTNNGWMLKEMIDYLFPELREIFENRIFVSAEFRRSKPDPEIYKALCKQLSFEVEDSIFIDDRIENVEGAQRAGLTGIHFKSADILQKELEEAIEGLNLT